jgi:uncharacterized protein YbjQ (UPF0145 family)
MRAIAICLGITTMGCFPHAGLDVKTRPIGEQRAAARIHLLESADLRPGSYTIIDRVAGFSCKHVLWDRNPEQTKAIEELRFRAMTHNANAVVNPRCISDGLSIRMNCWKSITCTGLTVILPSNSEPKTH